MTTVWLTLDIYRWSFFIKLEGPFTCEKIEIYQGASEWSFDCNNILDKDHKVMQIDLDEREEFEVTVVSEKEH